MHGGWCWQRVVAQLRSDGHDVLSPTLTGQGERAHLLTREVGLSTHVDDIVGLLDNEVRRANTVLVGHSYAGLVATQVAHTARGQVDGVIYLDAFVPRDGQSLLELEPPATAELYLQRARDHGDGWRLPPWPGLLARWGVSEEPHRSFVESRLTDFPVRCLTDRVSLAADAIPLPRAFLACANPDVHPALLPFAQRAQDEGWPYAEVRAGHDAMITAPNEVAHHLLALADNLA